METFSSDTTLEEKIEQQPKSSQASIFETIRRFLYKNPLNTKAEEYLKKLESDLILEPTECMQRNINELISSLGGNAEVLSCVQMGAKASAKSKLEVTQTKIIQRAIDDEKLHLISKALDFLNDEIFTDSQNPYFVLIDELDTSWIIKERKYRLIRALIETIKAFRKVRHVKIIIALRTDLYHRIITATKDEGFQQEKYETFLLPMEWKNDDLLELVNKRINQIFISRYTSQPITFNDIAPEKANDIKCFDYLIERTFLRPRHIIMFINACITKSVGKSKFTWTTVKEAEALYSGQRKTAIKDEWGETYGLIDQAFNLLESIGNSDFEIGSISAELNRRNCARYN